MRANEINEGLSGRKLLGKKTAGGITIYKYETEYAIEGAHGFINVDAKQINKVIKALMDMAAR